MSAGAISAGGGPEARKTGLDVLAAASFPGAGVPAVRELVARYARLLQACAKRDGDDRAIDDTVLVADPAFACWLTQTCGGERPKTSWPAPERATASAAHAATALDARSWPASLREIPQELCRPLTRDMGLWERHSPAALREQLTTAMAVLRDAWPTAADEVALLVRALVDGVAASGHQTSGSSAACPFVVAIKFASDSWPGFLADALVHESSHIRLRLMSRLVPVVDDDGVARYRHPWRPDPRPLEAVLVASHAFVAVRRFHARCARAADAPRARAEAERLEPEVGEALAQLRGCWKDLTPVGRRIAERLFHEEERTRRGELEP